MKKKIVKLSKIREIGIKSKGALSAEDVTKEVFLQQVEAIAKEGCKGLHCSQCCLKHSCPHIPEKGQLFAITLLRRIQKKIRTF